MTNREKAGVERWRKGEVAIATPPDAAPRFVPSEYTLRAPGLAIARFRECDYWRLTHVPSGYGIGPEFETLASARTALLAIKDMTDWTMPRHKVLHVAGVKEQVVNTIINLFGTFHGRAK